MRTQTEQNERTLEEVAPGERGVILQVGNENGPVKRRLVDMGLTPGTEVTVRKVAPFGDPVELNLRGYELSLRKADAAQIRVATGAEGERRAQTRRRRIGMVQHIPDEETLRRMDADHAHEAAEHGGVPDYASHDTREMKLALEGNPTCGKTTLFNALTGSNQYVGNWPGVTVEKKEGKLRTNKQAIIQDLPGIYSMSPFSSEEIVEDADGLQMMSFLQVKIPAGGALQFEVPTEDPDNPEYTRTLEGIILYNHSAYTLWPEGSEYDEDTKPLCSSVDGKTGIGVPGGV